MKRFLLIRDNFPNNYTYDFEEISLDWHQDTPPEIIENTLENIISGYLMVYDSISRKDFGKKICKLNESEVDSLKQLLPFKLILFQNFKAKPPPPPPPVEE